MIISKRDQEALDLAKSQGFTFEWSIDSNDSLRQMVKLLDRNKETIWYFADLPDEDDQQWGRETEADLMRAYMAFKAKADKPEPKSSLQMTNIKEELSELINYLREQQITARQSAERSKEYRKGFNDGLDHSKFKVQQLLRALEIEEKRSMRK